MAKNMDYLIKLQAQIDKALPKGFKDVAKEIGELSKKKQELANAQKAADRIGNSQKNMNETIKKLRDQRNELRKLEQAKKAGETLTKKEEIRYASLTKSVEKLNNKFGDQKDAYKRQKMEFEKLKIPLSSLDKQYKDTTRSLERLNYQQKIASKVQGFKGKMVGTGKKVMATVGKAALVGGAVAGSAAAYGAVQSAQAYTEFNGQMKRVQAISGATREEFDLLEKEAMKLGATTSFTSSQAAAGMEKMALAGFNTNQIIKGMPGVLNLASAAGEDLALVSDIVTDNLVPFGLTANDTGRFADVLAYGMSKTNVSVEMLGESFKYASGGAGMLGVSLEETVSALGLMGDQAIKSGMAGRGMDAMFQSLVKNSDALKKVGINVKNSKGEFVGIVETVKQFEKQTKNMSGMQKAAFLQDTFGTQGARAFSKLLSAEKTIDGVTYKGAAAVEQMVNATNADSVGAAERMKEVMLEGAAGTKTLFMSAVDCLKIAVGKKLLSDNVLEQVKRITTYISELANVINGVFNDDKENIFWRNVLREAKKFVSDFSEALKPGIEALKKLIPSEGRGGTFFESLGSGIIVATKAVSTFLKTFVPMVKLLVGFVNLVGLDNVLVFIGAFMGLTKIITIVNSFVSTLVFLKGAIVAFGGVLGILKVVFLALGAPVIWVGAAVALLLYYMHKFGGIKENLSAIVDVFKAIGEHVLNTTKFFLKWFTPFGKIITLIQTFRENWDSSVGIIENLKNVFAAFFEKLKADIFGIWETFSGVFQKIGEIPLIKKVIGVFKTETQAGIDGSHYNGLGYVPYDGYIAELHKGEAVLTAEENRNRGQLPTLNKNFSPGGNRQEASISVSCPFSPTIVVQGGGDISEQINKALEGQRMEFERMLKEVLYEQQRTRF